MKQVITWFEKVSQAVGAVILGIVLLLGLALFFNTPQVHAKPLTPEAKSYQVAAQDDDGYTGYYQLRSTRSSDPADKTQQAAPQGDRVRTQGDRNNELADNAKRNLDETTRSLNDNVRSKTDSVKDKLNLDEPIYPGTKKFVEDVKESVGNVIGNTKDAIQGIPEDAKDTINDSFKRTGTVDRSTVDRSTVDRSGPDRSGYFDRTDTSEQLNDRLGKADRDRY
jgi:cytoskeletal protein RodZ